MLISLLRICAAIFPASLVAVVFGGIATHYRKISFISDFLLAVPKIIYLPIAMTCFGLGETAKVFMLFLTAVLPLSKAVEKSLVKNRELIIPIKKASSSKSRLFFLCVIPLITPDIIYGISAIFPVLLSVLTVAELFGTVSGIGFCIMDSFIKCKTAEMFFEIILLCAFGAVIKALLDKAAGFLNHSQSI